MGAVNRRSIFIVNRGFQFRFAFYVCSWVMALSFAYPLMLSTLFDYFLRYLALDSSTFPAERLAAARESLIQFLILIEVAFLGIVFLLSLFVSHRIAGPLYKLQMYFQEVQKGRWVQNLSFRKTDYFQELADGYNAMMRVVNRKVDFQQQRLNEIQEEIRKVLSTHAAGVSPEVKKALEVLLVQKDVGS